MPVGEQRRSNMQCRRVDIGELEATLSPGAARSQRGPVRAGDDVAALNTPAADVSSTPDTLA